MRVLVALMTVLIASAAPLTAATYIGPGAGLSLIGALWALLVAVLTAVGFVVAWPVRKMLLRRRANRSEG